MNKLKSENAQSEEQKKNENYRNNTFVTMILSGITLISGVITVLSFFWEYKSTFTDLTTIITASILVFLLSLFFFVRYVRKTQKEKDKASIQMLSEISNMQSQINTLTNENKNQDLQNEQLKTDFEKQKTKNEQLSDALANHIFLVEKTNQGMQLIKNLVCITFDKQNKRYEFVFEKKFTVIAEELPICYKAQFYANKLLADKKNIKQFYSKNQLKWSDLGVEAYMSYGNSNNQIELPIINNPIDNGFLMPFDIYFAEDEDEDTRIKLSKGTEITLTYKYHVPIKFWGSYINRTVSYFEEETIVRIIYSSAHNKNLKVSVCSLLPDGTPNKMYRNDEYLDKNTYKQTQPVQASTGSNKEFEIEIRGTRYGRYRVWWDAAAYFGGDETNSPKVKDDFNIIP